MVDKRAHVSHYASINAAMPPRRTNVALEIEFRINRDRIYSLPPLTRRGVVATTGSFHLAPESLGEQCPGCGDDITESWSLEAENPGAVPHEGDAFAPTCTNCGFKHAGSLVERT
jgi:hypothetical protein